MHLGMASTDAALAMHAVRQTGLAQCLTGFRTSASIGREVRPCVPKMKKESGVWQHFKVIEGHGEKYRMLCYFCYSLPFKVARSTRNVDHLLTEVVWSAKWRAQPGLWTTY